ncbi:MAG: helix-turn-helix transcriptional regulator [Firmicutes bacterium]|nr:helix-turn-helix transcriptional regulator [Bacillota bacterium]
MINKLIEQKSITKYRLSQISQIPYTTVSDICNGKAQLEKCSAETIYKLAKALDVTMEELIEPCMESRCSFDLFRSSVCHRVKEKNDINFLIEVLQKDEIRHYYRKKWYAESLYLLGMVDYLSHLHDVPLCTQYDDLRKLKLKKPLFPTSILTTAAVSTDGKKVKEEALREAIPEFLRFNIVECEVRDIV